jgi:hypothetical protein
MGEFFSSINAKKDGFITLEYENIRFFFIPRHFVPPFWRGTAKLLETNTNLP